MQWDILKKEDVLKTVPFTVESLELFDKARNAATTHPYHRLKCPDWVNVVPVTPDKKVVLIRQSRAGNLKDVLEIPGGSIDADEKDPTLAAVRELEEETGFISSRVLPLGRINPNPALFNNNVHMFLALDAIPAPKRTRFPDESEKIEVVLVPINELDQMVRIGKIDSALAALTIMLAGKYIDLK